MGGVIAYAVFCTIAVFAGIMKGHFEDIEFEEEIQQMYLERRTKPSPISDQENGLAGVEKSASSQQSSDNV